VGGGHIFSLGIERTFDLRGFEKILVGTLHPYPAVSELLMQKFLFGTFRLIYTNFRLQMPKISMLVVRNVQLSYSFHSSYIKSFRKFKLV